MNFATEIQSAGINCCRVFVAVISYSKDSPSNYALPSLAVKFYVLELFVITNFILF